MKNEFVSTLQVQDFSLWEKMKANRVPFSFDLEVTARCNNDCRHCYINLPAGDKKAQKKELSLERIKEIAEQAVSLGAFWCLLTGGEPLLREDFFDIYLALKQKGLLVSVFTNATLLQKEHIELFKKYPPRDIEVTVYGVSQKSYEKVSRRAGSYAAFRRGLDLLLKNETKVRLKAMALRSNIHEFEQIISFCKKMTKDYFRFDPFLHFRFDRNPEKNKTIMEERLTPDEIVALERSDPERFESLKKECDGLVTPHPEHASCDHLFHCGAGNISFTISYDGFFRLCSSLWHPECVYDLKKGNLAYAWTNFIPKVRDMRSDRKEFLETCRICPLVNLCMWCPAHAHLEAGRLDEPVDYFCKVAHARESVLRKG